MDNIIDVQRQDAPAASLFSDFAATRKEETGSKYISIEEFTRLQRDKQLDGVYACMFPAQPASQPHLT